MSVLLAIDDERTNLVLVKANLRIFIPECKVLTASSGYEGIKIAQEVLPDTILLDIMMPGMSGFEVCELLKNDDTTKHIPIIFFSAYSKDRDSIIRGLNLGADAFLKKPIDMSELAAQVRVMLRIKKAEDSLKKEIDKYRIMTETIPDGVVAFKSDYIITYVSSMLKDIFGFKSIDELIGANAYDSLFAECPEAINQILTEVSLNNTIKDVELPLNRHDGNTFKAEISVSIIYDNINDTHEYIFVIKDISARKKDQEEILNYQHSLKSLNASLADTEERERKVIAEYLHDGVGQTLSLARMNLTSLSELNLDKKVRGIINESSELINDAISRTRDLTFDLSPTILYELGLIQAIKWKLGQLEESYNIKTKFKAKKGNINLNNNIRILLYRSVVELLTNIIKHAKASFIEIDFYVKNFELKICINDNGVGFSYTSDFSLIKHGGYGLFSIKEKLDSVGGLLIIDSKKKFGTKATIVFPLK